MSFFGGGTQEQQPAQPDPLFAGRQRKCEVFIFVEHFSKGLHVNNYTKICTE